MMDAASHAPPSRRNHDRVCAALLAAAFVVSLAASWQRWADPVVDVGREMNQPLRLASGEMLYSDVRHIYGPLSPWLHAALFRLFDPSLTLLYADGILTAAVVLALIYWLGRRVMDPAAAAGATLNVMTLCVFKPAGNYILPYSYNSLHGVALALITLTVLTRAVGNAHAWRDDPAGAPRGSARLATPLLWMFGIAGLCAGLAMLAKTEMGVPAVAAGITAAVLVGRIDERIARHAGLLFVGAAGVLTASVYAVMIGRAGWTAVASDSWLLLYNMPPEIAFFNGQVSGLGHPLRSLGRMLIALAKLGILAAFIVATSRLIVALGSRRARLSCNTPDGHATPPQHPWRLFASLAVLILVMSVTTGLDGDKGPFLAMPFLLIGLLVWLIRQPARQRTARSATLILFAVYAFVSLARMILHVRSGGAYASFLVPVSIVLLTYLWVDPFVAAIADARVARVTRMVALSLIIGIGAVNAGVLAYRSRARNSVAIASPRGTMIAEPAVGLAFNEALAFIEQHTAPTDAIAVLPEGTALTFMSGRRNPLREEIITPGYLDGPAESRAIRQLQDARTALILVPNRPTREFGAAVFGRDYDQAMMRWIETNYWRCAVFGPADRLDLEIGDQPYFIRAYCPRAQDQGLF